VSILNQTYTEIEVIVIDDGSTDCSYTICKSFQNIDARIKVFHQENQGIHGARNTGIKLALGEYILFVDDDDYIDEKYIEYLYSCIIKNDADLVIAGCKYVNDDGVEISVSIPNSAELSDLLENHLLGYP